MNSPTKKLTLVSVSLLLSFITAGKARALEPDGSIAIRLPKGVQLRNVALAATGSMSLGDRSVVSGPTAAVGSVANLGPGQTQIGVNANVRTNVISTPQALLASKARIEGSLLTTTAPTLKHDATVAGGITTDARLTPLTRLDWMPPAPLAGSDFTLKPNATGALSAGAYRNVTIFPRANVTLAPGVYQMNNFDLKPQATLTLDNRSGPIVIYVASTLIMKGTVELLGSGSNFGIIYEGTNATTIEAPFSGAIVAPYGQLRLAAMGSRQFEGQFIGQSLIVDPDVQVTYTPFNWDVIQPLFGAGNGIAGTMLDPAIHGAPLACFAPSFTATTQTINSDTVYTSIEFASPNPSQGVCAPQFCDEDGNPVPGPTQAQLNSAPAPGSTCPAIVSEDNCPVDTTSLTVLCTSDADCGPGGVCASRCVDTGCTNIEHRCGQPAASCADLPAESNCDEFRLCPLPGAMGTPNPQQLAYQLALTSSPSASGQISDSQQDTPPAEYASVNSLRCGSGLFPLEKQENLNDGSDKPASDGSSQWGVFIKPVTSFSVKPTKRTDGIGELAMEASGGVSAGGILFGNKVEVLGASIKAAVGDCGVTLTGSVKVFGEAVAVWTPSAGQAFHLATDNSGGSLATPAPAAGNCQTARDQTKDAIREARKANLLARAVRQYYLQHGLTPPLCQEIQHTLGPAAVTDPEGKPYFCPDASSLGAVPPVDQIKILNAWKKEYDGNTAKYVDFSKTLGTAQQAIQTSGTIDVFKTPHPYHVKVLDQDFPIGPVTLNLAVEGFGAWDIKGGIQFGVGVSGNFDSATAILANGLKGQEPRVGDIRAFAGPVITPELQVGVLAYVGVGIPGVSVGIQGQIDLLDISLPSGIVVAAMRLSEPDPRPLTGTDYEGTPIAGLESNDYRWVTGYNWGSKLELSELEGELDLAVRIHFLFFERTFKQKLFSWPGFTQTFPLVSGGGGDALSFTGDYGKQADNVAYTTPIPLITEPNVTTRDVPFGCAPPGPR